MKFRHLPLWKIDVKENVRSDPDHEIGDLMESIELHEIIQPVLVVARGERYELVSGHRRLAAMRARKEATIPAIIRDDISDADIPFVKLAENLQRKQLSPRELVQTFDQMLATTPGLTKRKLAHFLGKSDAWVYDKYKAEKVYTELLTAGLDEETVNDLSESELKQLGHIADPKERTDAASTVLTAPKGARIQGIKETATYDIERRGGYKDNAGGIAIYYQGKTRLLVMCDDPDIRDRVVAVLYKLKAERLEAK